MILQALTSYGVIKNDPLNRFFGTLFEYVQSNYIINLLLYPIDQMSKIFFDLASINNFNPLNET